MYHIRKFAEKDLEQIKDINVMLWLCVQWNGTYHKEDVFVAADEEENVIGVAALFYDGTWYYIEKNRDDIPLYRLQFELSVKENCSEEKEIRRLLLQALKERLKEFSNCYPDKRIAMRCWCEDTAKTDMQFYLQEGFSAHNLVWVLRFDLTKDIPGYRIPSEITISEHDFSLDGMKAYLIANEMGYDGVQDAEEELRFRMHDKNTVVFTAREGKRVVASTTVWSIGNGRSATENVFTIPQYRRQNIGRETLAYALRYLKEKGETLATLTCVGDNLPAISMYLGMGYELSYYLVEMHYTL